MRDAAILLAMLPALASAAVAASAADACPNGGEASCHDGTAVDSEESALLQDKAHVGEKKSMATERLNSTFEQDAGCQKRTGGSCKMLWCDSSRNAQCIDGECLCDASTCSCDGKCMEPVFEQIGPEDRACRGHDETDDPSFYELHFNVQGMAACKSLCIATEGCTGFEWQTASSTVDEGRCEVWLVPVQSSTSVKGYVCFGLSNDCGTSTTPYAAAAPY